jgi:hypothetical protein
MQEQEIQSAIVACESKDGSMMARPMQMERYSTLAFEALVIVGLITLITLQAKMLCAYRKEHKLRKAK